MAKAPRPGSQQVSDMPELVIIVDGTKYPFRLQEVTARDTGDLRRATGMSVRAVIVAMAEDPDIDVIAALVFLSKRQNGEPKVVYADVAAEIGYETTLDLVSDDIPTDESDESDPDSPEC